LSGVGMSINGVVGKAIVAENVEDAPARLRAFALLNVVLNAAAGVGPFVGTALVGHVADRALFGYVGVCYLVAVAVVAAGIEERPRPRRAASGVLDWRSYVGLFRERSLRFLIVTSAAVWFFYAPLFDAAFAHLGHAGRHVLSFNARKLAQVVGEGVGGFSGIALQNFFVHHGGESSYWWLLGACSLATSAVVHAVNVTQVTATASEL